ncbi:MAG: NAD(+) synthase [Crocinitomicaceae bacterium]|nr:MAG: NAD(+) synthase [Crocinitomicaceae bacterium]
MKHEEVTSHIVSWLSNYCASANLKGFVVGISGGIDSAITSTLCALTGKKVMLISMPIRQTKAEFNRASEHIVDLCRRFENVESLEIELTDAFTALESALPPTTQHDFLSMANTRARLRMSTLYAVGQSNGLLVAGTGNKVEDFGVGFFTKYGDGGVDLSPIADLTKTEVFELAKHLQVVDSIQVAKPTDGLWEDGRSDEDQIGATYPELEWAMDFQGDESQLSARESEVLAIYRRLNRINKHKMEPIPVCLIPFEFKR